MSSTTSRVGLLKPAGSENVDVVTALNNNWELLEDLLGATLATGATPPSSPWEGQFRKNTDDDRLYLRDTSTWNEIPYAGVIVSSTIRWGTLGDANAKLQLNPNGKLEFGAGGASAVDTNLYRGAANQLKTDDDLVVAGTLAVTGNGAFSAGTTGVVDTYSGICNSSLTLSTTITDVPGATFDVVTHKTNTKVLVTAFADVACSAFAAGNVAVLTLSVGGVAVGNQGLLQIQANGDRATISASWIVNIPTASTTTFKLRGSKTSASNTIAMQTTHTVINGVAFNAGL